MGVHVSSLGSLELLSDRIDQIGEQTLLEAGVVAEGLVKDNITSSVDSAGHRGRVQSGTTLQAVTARAPRRTGEGWRQVTEIVAPQDKLGPLIEDGRKPGPVSRAGRARIERWAKLKLRVPDKQLKSVGFLIARKIGRKGFPGIHPFAKARAVMANGELARIYMDVVRRLKGAP